MHFDKVVSIVMRLTIGNAWQITKFAGKFLRLRRPLMIIEIESKAKLLWDQSEKKQEKRKRSLENRQKKLNIKLKHCRHFCIAKQDTFGHEGKQNEVF